MMLKDVNGEQWTMSYLNRVGFYSCNRGRQTLTVNRQSTDEKGSSGGILVIVSRVTVDSELAIFPSCTTANNDIERAALDTARREVNSRLNLNLFEQYCCLGCNFSISKRKKND